MKFLSYGKDGGSKSTVIGFWLIELKRFFSIVLLRFSDGSRDEYHDHAFNSISWVLRGKVVEHHLDPMKENGTIRKEYRPSWRPVITRRTTFHRVVSEGTTWVISFRGPWSRTWHEYDPKMKRTITLTNGRVEV